MKNNLFNRLKGFVASAAAVVMAVGMMGSTALPVAAADPVAHKITITNTNTAVSIDGKEYKAYKLFSSTHSGTAYSYTLPADSPFYSTDLTTANTTAEDTNPTTMVQVLRKYFTFTKPSGSTTLNVSARDTYTDARDLANAIQSYLSDITKTGYVFTATASGETATINLNNDEAGLGYYIVTGVVTPKDAKSTETVEAAVMITNEDPSTAINPKADVPTIDKKITSANKLDDAGKSASAAVGSTVDFEIDSTVPNMIGYTKYTFTITDTMSNGLSFTGEDTADTINGLKLYIKDMADGKELAAAKYTVKHTVGAKTFTITIPKTTLDEYADGDAIKVTYSATVNENALSTDYEKNTAKLTYSNSPYTDTTNDTPDKTVYVVEVNVDVNKYAAKDGATTAAKGTYATDAAAWTAGYMKNANSTSDENYWIQITKVQGAEFQVFQGSTQPGAAESKWYHYNATDKKVEWVAQASADTFTTDASGNLVLKGDETVKQIRGLEASATGSAYGLVETKAPASYTLLKDAQTFTLKSTYDGTGNKITITSDGNLVTGGTITLNADPSTQPGTTQPTVTKFVENTSGSKLPETGGMGTTMFYVIGGCVVAAALALLVAKKRKNA